MTWATEHAAAHGGRVRGAWWYGGDTDQYADSIDDPANPANDNTKILQRHWIGVTPMDAEIVRPGRGDPAAGTDAHGQLALEKRRSRATPGEFGLFHTGTGPTSAAGGNRGPSCDSAVSTVQSERSVFSLNTGIMAVAEGNFGRLGEDEQQRYTTGNARIQLDPGVWEMPGAMPEIAPSPDFTANIDRALYDRSMVLQAWGTYGTLWPVVHHQLGVRPDLGRAAISRSSLRCPTVSNEVAGSNIRLGTGSVDVAAERGASTLTTTVTRHLSADLLIGHVLPARRAGVLGDPGRRADGVRGALDRPWRRGRRGLRDGHRHEHTGGDAQLSGPLPGYGHLGSGRPRGPVAGHCGR